MSPLLDGEAQIFDFFPGFLERLFHRHEVEAQARERRDLLHRHRQVLHAPGVTDDEVAGRQDIREIRLVADHFAIEVLVLRRRP